MHLDNEFTRNRNQRACAALSSDPRVIGISQLSPSLDMIDFGFKTSARLAILLANPYPLFWRSAVLSPPHPWSSLDCTSPTTWRKFSALLNIGYTAPPLRLAAQQYLLTMTLRKRIGCGAVQAKASKVAGGVFLGGEIGIRIVGVTEWASL